jgi:hypothetical protein
MKRVDEALTPIPEGVTPLDDSGSIPHHYGEDSDTPANLRE